VDNLAADTDGMASLRSPGFTLGVLSSEELTEPGQFMIAWLIKDSLADSYMSTG
jgi:hypothetical protein